MTLLRWLSFLFGPLIVTLTVLLFFIYLFLLTLVICSTMAFPLLENSDHVAVAITIDFRSNSKRDTSFHCTAYDYCHSDWDGFRDHLRLCYC